MACASQESSLTASRSRIKRRCAMETLPGNASRIARWLVVALLGLACAAPGQERPGPQPDAPPPAPVAAKEAPARTATNQTITVPAGTKFAVILQNGISTRSAKPGDSVYFQTAFPVTQDNRIVIPVGSYVRGSLLESKRPGRVKGKGEFRMRLRSEEHTSELQSHHDLVCRL